MAATGYSPIQLYYSTTASAAPTAGNLASGELAINITDGKLYYKDNAGAVQLLSTSTTANGTANGVLYLNGSKVATAGTALTFDGSQITLNGAYALDGDDFVYSYAGGTSGQRRAGFYLDGTNGQIRHYIGGSEAMRLTSTGLGIGTSSPGYKLQVYNNINGTPFAWGNATRTGYLYQDQNGVGITNAAGTGFDEGIFLDTANSKVVLYTNSTDRVTLDSSGNLGLGVTPSAGSTHIDVSAGGSLYGLGNGAQLAANSNFSSGSWLYRSSAFASRIDINPGNAGGVAFYTAPSGTAGNAITFTQAMTLDASGNLGIGTTSPGTKLVVTGAGNITSTISSSSGFAQLSLSGSSGQSSFITYTTTGGGGLGFFDATAAAERARIDSSGRFGIGATSLTEYLTVKSPNASTFFSLQTATDSGVYMGNNAGALTLLTGGTERARIDSSGNLLVGTTSTGLKTNRSMGFQVTGGCVQYMSHSTSDANGDSYIEFGYNGTKIGSITQSGTTAVLYNVTSDQRLKENIADADSASTLIDSLQVRKFDWKSDGNHQRYGFVAQELVTVAPEAVHQPADPEEMMAVDYSKLVPMLVKEIQSLRARVAQLESN